MSVIVCTKLKETVKELELNEESFKKDASKVTLLHGSSLFCNFDRNFQLYCSLCKCDKSNCPTKVSRVLDGFDETSAEPL